MSKREFPPEEIAKSLEVCFGTCCGCGGCIYEVEPDLSSSEVDCRTDLVNIAAGTIKAQAKRIVELEELVKDRTKDVLFYVEREKWIPTSERLPENDHSVLVIVSGRIGNIHLDRAIELAEFSMDEGWILEMWPEWENPTVTHWKPMPKGPEVGHDNQ